MSRSARLVPTVIEWQNGIPVVDASVERYRRQYLLYVACPYCGERHQHGGGSIVEDPRENAGHRLSHCVRQRPGDRGYIIRVPDNWREQLPLNERQR